MTDSYIGCKAQILTKSKFKYEGTISSINPLEMTIALQGVHVIEGPGKIDSDKKYSSVTFKSADVVDLQVFEPESPKAREEILTKQELDDPAVLAFEELDNSRPRGEDEAKGADWLDPQFYNGPPKLGPYSHLPNSYISAHPEAVPSAGKDRPGRHQPPQPNKDASMLRGDFDFAASNSVFQKSQHSGPRAYYDAIDDSSSYRKAGSFYDKNVSFFDSLTFDAEEKREKRDQANEERAKNLETFGTTGNIHHHHHHYQGNNSFRGRRGRGRGRRGGGGGGGGGGSSSFYGESSSRKPS